MGAFPPDEDHMDIAPNTSKRHLLSESAVVLLPFPYTPFQSAHTKNEPPYGHHLSIYNLLQIQAFPIKSYNFQAYLTQCN